MVSDIASLFSQLLCFLWIGKQKFKNEFVIWKDSCDQVFLNRIQDVIFELHYPHQRKEREIKREIERKGREGGREERKKERRK